MLVKFDEECCKVRHIDDPNHVGLTRSDSEGSCRVIIYYCRVRNGFCVVYVNIARASEHRRVTCLRRRDSESQKEILELGRAFAGDTSPTGSTRVLHRIGQRKARLDHE